MSAPSDPRDPVRREEFRRTFPLRTFDRDRNEIPFIDGLSDDDLAALNEMLDWNCFVADRHGRRFGKPAWEGKRDKPQVVADRRIALLDECFHLADKHVLEPGCFEGIYTIELCRRARRVTAVDARIENVVKTIVRSAFFGCHPTVFKCNIEERPLPVVDLAADVVFHVGVLYHLRDPVPHLLELGRLARCGVMLDTHYAEEEEATEAHEVDGRRFRHKSYRGERIGDPFSGVHDHSKWLTLEDIRALLTEAGFAHVEVRETEHQRTGPRALILATR